MHFLSKVVFLVHEVRETFVRDIKKIDERLNVSSLKKVAAYALSVIILVFIDLS